MNYLPNFAAQAALWRTTIPQSDDPGRLQMVLARATAPLVDDPGRLQTVLARVTIPQSDDPDRLQTVLARAGIPVWPDSDAIARILQRNAVAIHPDTAKYEAAMARTILSIGIGVSGAGEGGNAQPPFAGPLHLRGLAQQYNDPLASATVHIFQSDGPVKVAEVSTDAYGAYDAVGAYAGIDYLVLLENPNDPARPLVLNHIQGEV